MEDTYNIAGYCRISVDDDLDRDNTSIENQKAIIKDYVTRKFPDSTLTLYEDRDKSGYTFEQRDGYQEMRKKLVKLEHNVLIIKDFSRFSRRNSKGLVELEDLRDFGVRIISIGDNIDYPTYDEWTAIQFRFLINEMPVTDASKKVKAVIKRRQNEGKWICSVPYGYVMTNTKKGEFEVDDQCAEVVRKIFELYNSGWGYKKIANYLTDQKIPTPRMFNKINKELKNEECKLKAKKEWSIITISEILANDFYIGTLRQGKYQRKKINGSDNKTPENSHVIFKNNHDPIIDHRTFSIAQNQMKVRTAKGSSYRGIKKYDNVYSGFLFCGDCGSPMFSMSKPNLAPAYTCGSYHKRGLKGCTSHHTRVDTLDKLLKSYIRKIKDNSEKISEILNYAILNEKNTKYDNTKTISNFESQIESLKIEMKSLVREKARELARNPSREEIIDEMYNEMIDDISSNIEGLQNQISMMADKYNSMIQANNTAKTAIDIFDDILNKESLEKTDLYLIIEKITVFEDHIDIQLKSDITNLLEIDANITNEQDINQNFNYDTINISKLKIVQSSDKHKDKVYSVNVVNERSPSLIRIVRLISLGITTLPRSSILLTIPVAFMDKIPPNIF